MQCGAPGTDLEVLTASGVNAGPGKRSGVAKDHHGVTTGWLNRPVTLAAIGRFKPKRLDPRSTPKPDLPITRD